MDERELPSDSEESDEDYVPSGMCLIQIKIKYIHI
jgi:hypothetical protein